MRFLLAVLLAAAPGLPASAQEENSDSADARITRVEGSVYLLLKDHPESGFIPAQVDAPLAEGDQVRTGSDGRAELAFDDESVVEVGPNSDLIVSEMTDGSREVFLGIGSLVAKLKKLLEGRTMRFRTPTAVAAVRGTELAVSQEGDDQAVVGVFDEGEVVVTPAEGEGKVVLGPNQEAECHRGKGLGEARKLRRVVRHRARMKVCRARHKAIGQGWKRRPMEARREFRRRLHSVKALEQGQMRKVARHLQRRDYRQFREGMRERWQQRREERRERRQDRREDRRDNRQDMRQDRREDRREGRQERREGMQDRRQDRREGRQEHWDNRRENRQNQRQDRRQDRRDDRQEQRQDRRQGKTEQREAPNRRAFHQDQGRHLGQGTGGGRGQGQGQGQRPQRGQSRGEERRR